MQMSNTPPPRKSICFLTPSLIVGGVERVLIDTISIISFHYDITVVALRGTPEESVANELIAAGAKLIAPDLPNRNLCLLVPYLSKFHYEKVLKNIDYDYLICVNCAAMNAGFNKKANKTVFWNHMDNVSKYVSPNSFPAKIKRVIFKLLYGRYDTIWTVCDKITQDFTSAFQIKNIHTLPNPIDYDSILSKSNAKCDVDFDKNFLNVVSVGRFGYEKATDRLVNIWISVTKEVPNARLYLIGDGSTRKELEEIIQREKLENNVFMLGKKENPFPYLKQADLFVCPSREESFGLVILEAMLLGIPVITTATAGGKYTTKDGTLAVCVDNDDDALSEAIMQFLSAPNKYPYSLEKAKQAAQSYDLPYYQENILRLLKQLEEN